MWDGPWHSLPCRQMVASNKNGDVTHRFMASARHGTFTNHHAQRKPSKFFFVFLTPGSQSFELLEVGRIFVPAFLFLLGKQIRFLVTQFFDASSDARFLISRFGIEHHLSRDTENSLEDLASFFESNPEVLKKFLKSRIQSK